MRATAEILVRCARPLDEALDEPVCITIGPCGSWQRVDNAVIVGWIAIHGVDVHRGVAPDALWRKLDKQLRPLNAIVSGAVAVRLVCCRAAPREPGVVETDLNLGGPRLGISNIDNAAPLGMTFISSASCSAVMADAFSPSGTIVSTECPGPATRSSIR